MVVPSQPPRPHQGAARTTAAPRPRRSGGTDPPSYSSGRSPCTASRTAMRPVLPGMPTRPEQPITSAGSPRLPLTRFLITSCRTVVVRWFAGLELCREVIGPPPLPLADGLQQQRRPCRDVCVSGLGALPEERPVIDGVGRLHAGFVEQLPNEFGPLAPVVGEGLVGPLTRNQHPPAGDPEVLGLVCFALALTRRGVHPYPLGLDAIQQPHRTAGRTRGDPEFGDEPEGVLSLPVRSVL